MDGLVRDAIATVSAGSLLTGRGNSDDTLESIDEVTGVDDVDEIDPDGAPGVT